MWMELLALKFFSNKYITNNVEGINETRWAKCTHYFCLYLRMSIINFKTFMPFIILFKVPTPLSKKSWGPLIHREKREDKGSRDQKVTSVIAFSSFFSKK